MRKYILLILIPVFFFKNCFSQVFDYFSLNSSWKGQDVRFEEGDTATINVTCFYKGESGEDIDSVLIFGMNKGVREFDNGVTSVSFPKHIYPNDSCTFRFKVLTQNQPVIFERYITVITKSKRRESFSFYFTIIPKKSNDLQLSEYSRDFGKLKRAGVINYKIIYKNVGLDTIKISDYWLIGNTALKASKIIVPPGDTGSFNYGINTCNYSGPFNNRVWFSTENIPAYKYEFVVSGWLEKRNHPLTFENIEHDFGKIILKKDSAVKTLFYQFKFKNTSKTMVIIDRINTGDGGFYGYGSTRGPIKPGEEGFVKVMLHPYPKRYQKTVTVNYLTQTDDEGCSYSDTMALKVKAEVTMEE